MIQHPICTENKVLAMEPHLSGHLLSKAEYMDKCVTSINNHNWFPS